MELEQFEQRQSDSETPRVLADAGILSAADNRILTAGRGALKLPAGFPDVSASDQWSHSSPQPSGPERPDDNYHAPPADPALPGLPPPSRGHRQIVHLTPKRYIDIPYPEDFSIRNGVTYGTRCNSGAGLGSRGAPVQKPVSEAFFADREAALVVCEKIFLNAMVHE